MAGDEVTGTSRWTFTEAELQQAMEEAHTSAAQEMAKPLSLEEGCRLVLFYAQKLPELCGLCGAPSEVRWTATIFYRRFFAVRSPMEFDPVKMMFASVHLACKIEEVHEITLDKLLESTGFGQDPKMPLQVAALELPLLEGIGFTLLVEPKPDSTLRMLMQDLRRLLEQGQQPAEDGGQAANAAAEKSIMLGLTEAFRDEVLQAAEDLTLQLSIRTNAVLCWPISAVLAAALHAAVEDAATARGVISSTLTNTLYRVLDAGLETDAQRTALQVMIEEVLECIRGPTCTAVVEQAEVQDTVKAVRRCHRAFERLREEASAEQEAQRKERKRNYRQMRGALRSLDTQDVKPVGVNT